MSNGGRHRGAVFTDIGTGIGTTIQGGGYIGLTTTEALHTLRDDIAEHLALYQTTKLNKLSRFHCLYITNPNTVIGWPSLCVLFVFGFALYIAFAILFEDESSYFLFFQGTLIIVMGLSVFFLVYNEERLMKNEIQYRVQHSLNELERAAIECSWNENNYPHLCAPFSPCVTLQWTYRDGKVVNLPWALLVRGDIILMRPGQESPGHCVSIDDTRQEIQPRQIFQPSKLIKEKFSVPRAVNPHKSKLFKIKTTPFLHNLQLALEEALNRPATIYNKQRHRVTIKFIEAFILPMIIIVCLITICVRHFYLYELIGSAHWTKVFILQLIAATLPLLPNMFPIAWIALNIYGMAKFKHLLNRSVLKKNESDDSSSSVENPLLTQENLKTTVDQVPVYKTFWKILLGKENFIVRSANIVHVLGSVTALCCVDKKGILSWPNPTAEKVFFFRNQTEALEASSKISIDESSAAVSDEDGQEIGIEKTPKAITTLNANNTNTITTVAEVLDLTHDQNIPFKLEFDDNLWKNHISSLKPLGLAILINTCNMNTQEHYAHFCSHLTSEATQTEDTVPVTNRRCLCELAKQIGFSEEAKNIYSLQTHIATFRHLQPDIVRRDTKFARSLHLNSRVKVPFPHMLGVIIKDHTGGLQLMTQGTADIILDSCVEYWNGQSLCMFSPTDRKKVLDFYQRSSLTAYCSAFAYRPLNRGISSTLASMYVELPADCRTLFPTIPTWNEPQPPLSTHYHSTDSLLFSDMNEEDVNDVNGCFDLQCNQIFIGMVTMQYQAQSDMVELIERLDRACIRFVHFSKENELRSRVFSEKMGLESGWNCHISLLSENERQASPTSQNLPTPSCSEKCWKTNQTDQNTSGDKYENGERVVMISSLEASRPLSNSAPGAINLEHTTVKFYNETGHVRYDIRKNSIIQQKVQNTNDSDLGESQDSVLLGEWEEADHSPPDGCRSLSCLTDSTDHSAPVNFDMRNRAKLPRGIDNIRPHIEQVDNVPLLVSLFTDCTANTARRMIGIMQDYNEVVCVMGSAANKDNMEIFMQADASIAVEPLYPVLCQKVPPYVQPKSGIGPVDLARILNSIPCSISISKEENISLFSLVTMARHFMMCLWSASQFWLCSLCCLTLIQVMSLLLAFPIIFSIGNVMWLSFVVIPLISMSLVPSEIDPSVMGRASNKHQETVDRKLCFFVLWCYGYKFLPSVICILVYFSTMLRTYCENYIIPKSNGTVCTWIYPTNGNFFNVPSGVNYSLSGDEYSSNEFVKYSVEHSNVEWKGWGDVYSEGYVITQDMCLILMTLLLVTISISFVHREYSLWQRNVFSNKLWVLSILIVFLIQILYTCLSIVAQHDTEIKKGHLVFDFPFLQLIWLCATPPIILSINEFIKWQEIKANKRYQRRARLDFGTKLGMNSPF